MKMISSGRPYDTPKEIANTAREQEGNSSNTEPDFRIARDGTWFYHGSPILRKSLVKLYSTVLKCGSDGRFWLETPVERVEVSVEDAPFIAVSATQVGGGENQIIYFQTNLDEVVEAGPEHPIHVAVDPDTGQPAPYVIIRPRLEALIARSVFYDLVLWAEEDTAAGELFLQSKRIRFSLGRFLEEKNQHDANASN